MIETERVKSFILGKEAYPDWFKELSDKGKVQYRQNGAGAITSITIQTDRTTVVAKPGDAIINMGVTIAVVPENAVEKYMRR